MWRTYTNAILQKYIKTWIQTWSFGETGNGLLQARDWLNIGRSHPIPDNGTPLHINSLLHVKDRFVACGSQYIETSLSINAQIPIGQQQGIHSVCYYYRKYSFPFHCANGKKQQLLNIVRIFQNSKIINALRNYGYQSRFFQHLLRAKER